MIIFTAVPPPARWDKDKIKQRAEEIINIVKRTGLKIINLPEVPERGKISPLEFSRIIKDFYREVDVIIDKVVSSNDLEGIFEEISTITDKIALVNIGEKRWVVNLAKNYFREIYGITIFTREKEDMRLFLRTTWGFNGFISQIIFETETLKRTLEGYYELCEKEKIKPAKIIVSLAPLRGEKDVIFLEGFRVEIPEEIRREINLGRGFEVAKKLAKNILSIPGDLGINVEHVMIDNLGLAEELLIWLLNPGTQTRTTF